MKKTILIAALLQAFSITAYAGQGAGLVYTIVNSGNFEKIHATSGEVITAAKELGKDAKWQQCISEAEEIFKELKPIAEKQSGADLSDIKIAHGIRKVLGEALADFDPETKTITASSEFCFQIREVKEFVIGHELGHAIAGDSQKTADDLGARIASAHLGENISVAEFDAMEAENHVKAARMEARLHALKPTVEVGESIILVRSGK